MCVRVIIDLLNISNIKLIFCNIYMEHFTRAIYNFCTNRTTQLMSKYLELVRHKFHKRPPSVLHVGAIEIQLSVNSQLIT